MIVVLSFFAGDVTQAQRLLRWMRALGGCGEFDILLLADAATPFDQVVLAQELAQKSFKAVHLACTHKSVLSWPVGPNANWWAASKWCQERGVDWLFLEPDCAPLRPGWLDAIASEYAAHGAPFMGSIEDCQMPMMPPKVMSGVAVYPANCYERLPPMPGSVRPWNTDASSITVPNGSHTALIRDFFGTRERPPVFVESKTPTAPLHHLTPDWLPGEAVIFHRDKTHSLIPLLAKKLGIEWVQEVPTVVKPRLAVVFPVHQGDIHLALHHALWLRKMNVKWPNRAVIAHDPFASRPALAQLHAHLSQCFTEVEIFKYGVPPIRHYPWAANFAFQSTARHMYEQDSPWLWMEADAVALKPDWLDQLEAEYYRAGKAWMGSVVPHMSHLQGTAIYPCDAAARMPGAMGTLDGAFDMHIGDSAHDRHDATHLMHHVWSLVNRMSCPTGGGEIPARITANELRQWLPKTAVFLHRVKDNSVLNLLLTGQYQHL